MKLTAADWLRIAGVIIGLGGALTPQALEAMGIATGTAAHVAAVVGFVVVAVSIVSRTLSNPSAPSGTNFAVIPDGTIPVVGTSLGQGPSVAKIDPASATVQPLSQKG